MYNEITASPSMPTPGKLTRSKRLQGKDVGIPVRKMGLTFGDDLPTLWAMDNAFLTMFFTGFSGKLPDGEAQFIHSIRLFQDQITDPVLQAQVRAFIGQEGHHAYQHRALNEAMTIRGIPVDKIEERHKKLSQWMQRTQSPEKQLAMTVCAEHLTALLADYAISKDPSILDSFSPRVRELWGWHCIEESEHKAVAFDVYEKLVGDRKLLKRTMVEVTIMFLAHNFYDALELMLHTGQMKNIPMWKQGGSILVRMAKALKSDYLDFFRPNFHPWWHDNRQALEIAKKKYLATES